MAKTVLVSASRTGGLRQELVGGLLLGSNGVATGTAEAGSDSLRSTSNPPLRRAAPRWAGRFTAGHVLPVILAVLAGVLVLVATNDRSATELVAVSSHQIQAGMPVTGADLRWASVHRSDAAVTAGLFSRRQLSEGWVAAVTIPAGSPVVLSELRRGPSPAAGLGAMSLPVLPALAAGGDLAPGDRVDVISTGATSAGYVAMDLLVLAVANGRSSGVLGSLPADGYYVTLAVDRSTALRLAAVINASSAGQNLGYVIVRSTGESAGSTPGPSGTTPTAASAAGSP